jgi:hypothetical protein
VIDPHKWDDEKGCRLCHTSNLAFLYPEDGDNIIPTKDGTTQTTGTAKKKKKKKTLP